MLGIRGFKTDLLLILLLVFPAVEAATVEFETGGFTQQVAATSVQKLELDWPSIQRLYDHFDAPFLWHQGATLNERGRQLLTWLSAAEQEGLNPANYHLNHLRRLSGAQQLESRLVRELLLTDGYLRLATDLRQGNPAARALDPFAVSNADSFDPVMALIEALEWGDLAPMLARLSPTSREYDRLRQALARYREIESAGGWPSVEQGHTLRPGMWDLRVIQLRERLARELGPPVSEIEDPLLFDGDLADALRRFQSDHGLAADGVLGPATLVALNVPAARRVSQLRANLERWRWLPHDLGDVHLLVNTAGFDFAFHVNGRVIYSGRTVNGRAERQTPSLISEITHLIANPYWTVPRRIAIEDLLPQQQADPDFLLHKGIRTYRNMEGEWVEFDPSTIDWSDYHEDNFPFILKQDAGAGNSLGRVKFHLPNRYNIYLHDTPSVRLFQRSQRAFSSGCVRVEGAHQLASLLLTLAAPEEARRFNRAMQTGETLITALRKPIPVYLTYFTSWVDETGEVHFYPDIYRRDTDLLLAIGVEKRPETTQHLADSAATAL